MNRHTKLHAIEETGVVIWVAKLHEYYVAVGFLDIIGLWLTPLMMSHISSMRMFQGWPRPVLDNHEVTFSISGQVSASF